MNNPIKLPDYEEIVAGFRREFYPNGYGVSVIEHQFSYGLEVAVLTWEKKRGIMGEAISTNGEPESWTITYTSGLTDDVIGHIKNLEKVLSRIKNLPIRDSHK